MSARGRLIFPFVVELGQIDAAATAADPDAAGPLTSGYDSDFRAPVKVLDAPTDQTGVTARQESIVQVRAQIEPDQFERLSAMLSGDAAEGRFTIILHFRDLERAGLVDAVTGRPLLYKRDRIIRILTPKGVLVETIPNPPGLFCVEVQSRGFGPGGRRNLLLMAFESRDPSIPSA